MIIFDIETGPLPYEQIEKVAGKFDPNLVPHPGEFDPSSVKTGNTTDPVKIEAKIEAARQKHEKQVAEHGLAVQREAASYRASLLDRAALNPMHGQVIAIGYYSPEKQNTVIHGQGDSTTEPQVLECFWSQYGRCREQNRKLVGFNTHRFDLPFLIRRSWFHSIDVPPTVLKDGRYFDSLLVDLRKVWGCGEHSSKGSLGEIATFFGIGGKPEDGTTGADFARLWTADRERAKAYLENDLQMTAKLAERLCIY